MSSQYAIQRITLEELIFLETGTYDDQFIRPWRFTADEQTKDRFADLISGVSRITPELIAPISNQIIRPSSEVESIASILNGWDERRARFRALVSVKKVDDSQNYYYELLGYTSNFGFTNAIYSKEKPSIDPSMILHINSVQKKLVSGRRNGRRSVRIQGACNLITQNDFADETFSIRPEDILREVQNESFSPDNDKIRDEYPDTNDDGYEIENVVDLMSIVPAGGIKSRRANSSPSRMVSDVLDGIFNNVRSPDSEKDVGGNCESVIHTLRSENIRNDEVLTYIAKKAGVRDIGRPRPDNEFSWKEFLRAFPDAQEIYEAPQLTNSQRNCLDKPGRYNSWKSRTPETIFADEVAKALPGYMIDHCFLQVAFNATNNTPGSEIIVTMTGDTRMADDNANEDILISSLERKIIYEVLMPASYGGQLEFNIDVYCQVNGQTRMSISLDDEEAVDYCAPTFADSQSPPVITDNIDTIKALSKGFSELIDITVDRANESKSDTRRHSDEIYIPGR